MNADKCIDKSPVGSFDGRIDAESNQFEEKPICGQSYEFCFFSLHYCILNKEDEIVDIKRIPSQER